MSFAHRYAAQQSETASPERLMVLLFERALGHMNCAAAALEGGQAEAARQPLEKAGRIVAELARTLDVGRAPALGEQLLPVYRFVAQRLLEAGLHQSATPAREAARAFAPVVEAFAAAIGPPGERR